MDSKAEQLFAVAFFLLDPFEEMKEIRLHRYSQVKHCYRSN